VARVAAQRHSLVDDVVKTLWAQVGRRDESVAGVGLCMAVDFVAEMCGGADELLPASDGDD